MRRNAVGSVAVWALALAPAAAQTLRIDPEKVLYKDMEVLAVGPFVSQPRAGSGAVWARFVQHTTPVPAVRVHIQVRRGRPAADWRIRIRDLSGREIESIAGDRALADAGEFWSGEVPGRGAEIELVTDTDSTGLEIAVDRYAYRVISAIPQGIIGVPNLMAIRRAAQLLPFAGPIARLSFIKDGNQFVCTGFMVTGDLLLTNEHCLSTPEVARSALVEFGFDSLDATPTVSRVTKLEAVSVPLDYALVRLGQGSGAFGRVALSGGAVTEGQKLAIIQHPAGEFKQASFDEDCLVRSATQPGVTAAATDFSHRCDTLGGSSGSPVLDRQTGAVVGLHHWGFVAGSPDPVNQGVHIGLVLADLLAQAPAVRAEITTLNP